MLLLNDKPISYFTFPGGEINVRLPEKIEEERIVLTWKPKEAFDIPLLMMTVSALKNNGYNDIDIDILYLPYARQDRVCNPGEAFSLEAICNFISSLGFSTIRLWDVHNQDDTFKLLENEIAFNITPEDIFPRYDLITKFRDLEAFLCAPDEGGLMRVRDLSKLFPYSYIIQFFKRRELTTGKIEEIVYSPFNSSIEDRNILIIDDICDGGGTFIQEAQILKEKGAKNLYLYVTHGIFSKGFSLLSQYFEHIYCHHVLHDHLYQSNDKLTILREFPHAL